MARLLNIVIWYVGINAKEKYSASTAAMDIKVCCSWHHLLFSDDELVRSLKWVSYFNLRYIINYNMKYLTLNCYFNFRVNVRKKLLRLAFPRRESHYSRKCVHPRLRTADLQSTNPFLVTYMHSL